MSSILALKDYGNSSGSSSGDEDSDDVEQSGSTDHTNPSPKAGKSMPVPTAPITLPSQSQAVKTGEIVLKAAPEVLPNAGLDLQRHIDPSKKEIMYNPKTDELFAPEVGPVNPFKTKQQQAPRNSLAGYVEPAHVSEFQFETQRRTFASYGYAIDPTSDEGMADGTKYIGQVEDGKDLDLTVFHAVKARPGDKRKKERNDDPTDLEGFKGPWAKYVGEQTVAKPTEEEAAEIEERLSKRQKKGKPVTEERMVEEKAVIHIDDVRDYQGRSFLHAPHDLDVNLRADNHPDRCFLPKKHIHTWQAHNKGVCAIRWFPRTAHLMLSCGMDSKIKLYEVYKERRCIATYSGHKQAVRDCCFNNAGTQFLSASYDRYIKLWDTETGKVVSRFNSRKIPYCVKFNPDGNKQHLFVAGTADKKILCWDTRSGEIVQEYDRHLGAVNTITFVDNNRRFVSTSDDKSMRVWEWNIPVDMKYIADPTMHSMPAVTLSPTGKWLACQSMDNKISIFSAFNRYKLNRKKFFTGHMVAGYACSMDFSPDMSYLMSGDADGKVFVWDWKTTKLFSKWKAHDGVCIGVLWHPHETSKVASAGWDGVIKLWD